jgi:hypothetical protein
MGLAWGYSGHWYVGKARRKLFLAAKRTMVGACGTCGYMFVLLSDKHVVMWGKSQTELQ